MDTAAKKQEKIKLTEINLYLTCYLCKGYLIDATTISECLHSFCRSCIIKFLQDKSFCPVCEVIINKAKPNLKPDKTLQDIVYKLVPELFLKEMMRRKQFYRQYPHIACRVSPEERGEDTERTIFNPRDCISLSMEYVSDDSTPGAICLPGSKNGIEKFKNLTPEENQALMKRYLQCPGMCRVEVLKKFVRNKYNVDTNQFYIDILYKRVPLPDHYTLIDIAYIYCWKRNEPMTFYFRITDINKVCDRFDYFNGAPVPEFVVRTPARTPRAGGDRRSSSKKKKKTITTTKKPSHDNLSDCDTSKSEVKVDEGSSDSAERFCDSSKDSKSENVAESAKETKGSESDKVCAASPDPRRGITTTKTGDKDEKVLRTSPEVKPVTEASKSEKNVKEAKSKVKDNGLIQSKISELAEQIKNKLQNNKNDVKNSVYTNITLNRTNNVEIITKIQKVSNKEGQPIGLNIIKQTVKKGMKRSDSPLAKTPKKLPTEKIKPDPFKTEPAASTSKQENERSTNNLNVDEEKERFFKSIELTAKTTEPVASTSAQKRKNSSPIKNDKSKKPKVDKKPTTKIIIQPKRNAGLQTFIGNCKINIPSSLSITLKDSSEARPPPLAPPAKNYIEILKLDENDKTIKNNIISSEPTSRLCDNDSEQKVDQDLSEIAKSLTEKIPMSTTVSQIVGPKAQFSIPVKNNTPVKFHNIQPSPVPELPCKVLSVPKENKLSPRSPQTFQKIFEESIKKPEEGAEKSGQKALDLSSEPPGAPSNKRNILEIASQLFMKTKLEQEKTDAKNEEGCAPVPKVPIPRLPSQKSAKPRQKFPSPRFELADTVKFSQTLTNVHSNALGLNYTISIGQNVSPKANGMVPQPKEADNKDGKVNKPLNVPVGPNSFPTPKDLPSASPRPNLKRTSPCLGYNSPRNSPKHSPKSSPIIKHMYAPSPSLMARKMSPKLQKLPSPKVNSSPSNNSVKVTISPKANDGMKNSPKLSGSNKNSPTTLNQIVEKFPQPGTSPRSTEGSPSASSSKTPSKPSGSGQNSPLSPNQILEKYNIQNLAQLTASLNFNATNFGLNSNNQLAALQHAMLFKHFEMQNRQNWLNMNQGPLLQYEKYLQSLKSNPNQLLGNIKEN